MTARYQAHDSEETALSTTLNSLANGGNKITATALSNDAASTERRLFANFRLHLAAQASARDADSPVHLYIIPEVGDTYAYGGDSLDPSFNNYVGSFRFDATTTARDFVIKALEKENVLVDVIGADKYGGRVDAWVYIDGVGLDKLLIDAGLGRKYSGGKRQGWCE